MPYKEKCSKEAENVRGNLSKYNKEQEAVKKIM
jgi:hypothetical protein